MKTQILTPTGSTFEGDAVGVKLPGIDGSFEVRKGHTKLVSLLDIGKIVVKTSDQSSKIFAISGGFAEVKDDIVTVMAEEAVDRDEIDLPGEMIRKKEFEDTLRTLKIDTEKHIHTETELRKVTNRINIAQS